MNVPRLLLLLPLCLWGAGCGASSSPLPSTANSITVTQGAGRADPEGIATTSPSTSLITWKDSRGADRKLTLYGYLYQYDYSFVGGQMADPTQVTQRSADDDAYGHPGFGYIVSHASNGNSPIGKGDAPTLVKTSLFSGAHHAVHHVELTYVRDQEGGGDGIAIPVVIEWFVATGRDHPVWAVTYEMGKAANPDPDSFDDYRMDTRAPYGSLNFDGAAKESGDVIGGVSWGDFGLRFRTTDANLTLASPWTYNTPSTVDFVQAWTATTNAEMGIVQTAVADKTMGYPDRVVGRERGSTSADAYTGKGVCTDFGGDGRTYSVPCVDGWPYQLMNYDWDPTSGKAPGDTTSTKLVAWGTPYGFLGASNADLFDFSGTYDASGDRSYATFIVLGPKCRYGAAMGACDQPGDVDLTLQTVEALGAATLSVSPGVLVSQAPRGPGASQMKTLSNGYNDTFGVYWLRAVNQQVVVTFTPAPGQPVEKPIFHIDGYTATSVPAVSLNGTPVTVNSGDATSQIFASLDTDNAVLWVTVNQTLGSATQISISAPVK